MSTEQNAEYEREMGSTNTVELATELADWLDCLAAEVGCHLNGPDALRYAADHIRQDIPAFQRDLDRAAHIDSSGADNG